MKELQQEADKANGYAVYSSKTHGTKAFAFYEGYIAGANSKYIEKQKLQFAIDELNKLNSILDSKIETLNKLIEECKGKMKNTGLKYKKSGIKIAKEDIKRNIKELQQQLNEL